MQLHTTIKSGPMSTILLGLVLVSVLADSVRAAAVKKESHPSVGNSNIFHHDSGKLKGTFETSDGRDSRVDPLNQLRSSNSHLIPSSKLGRVLQKRLGDMQMNGFHGDTFSDGFGDFSTSKRGFGVDAFHGDTFSDGFGSFTTAKRGFNNDAFHGDTFSDGFGSFSTSKRGFGQDAFHGDTFSDGFGDFSPSKRSFEQDAFHGDTFSDGFGHFAPTKRSEGQFNLKRTLGNDAFHGDTFSDGFGEFTTF